MRYLPKAGKVTVNLEPGRWEANWFNAISGEKITLPADEGPAWTSGEALGREAWRCCCKRNGAGHFL